MTSQTVLLYLLKSTLISGIFIAYYLVALRDKKFHYYNRFYLLSASIISLIAPLLNFNWFTIEEPTLLYRSNELIQFVLPTTTSDTGIHLDFADYILVFTIIITIVLLGLLLLHILKIQLLKRKCEVTKMDGFDFIDTNEDNAPFSFLNNLFWKQSISLQEVSGQQIFKHEITHIQQKHTLDRIYCQIVASIFWMNPFNWVIQKELVAIHEFIADEEAVGNSNVEAFAKMLLQTHYGNHFLNPTHSFFYSSIKRRLAMLTQTSNPKYSYLRRVMVLPILVVTISLVSIKVNAREKIENKVDLIKRQIESLISDTTNPRIINIKADTVDQKGKPTYFVEGVKITEKEMNLISANDILSVNVLKGEKALKKYPKDGKDGVVEIVLKIKNRTDQQPNKEWSNINASQFSGSKLNQIRSLEMTNGVKVEFKGDIDTAVSNATPLYVLDGVPIKNFDGISPVDIESIKIMKDPASTSLYGNSGKNGVFLITTKKGHVGNLQNKMEDAAVISYSNVDSAEVTTVFVAPKIQKNVDPQKNNDPIFYTTEEPAKSPVGWSNYLMNNLDRNLPYRNKAVPGKYTVKLNFVVNKNGEVENVKAENDPGYGTAKEAIRVIENGPKWIPAEQNGKKVNYLMKQVIVFNVTGK